jgi:hypothetical protein
VKSEGRWTVTAGDVLALAAAAIALGASWEILERARASTDPRRPMVRAVRAEATARDLVLVAEESPETLDALAPLPAIRFARELIGAGIRMLLAETRLEQIIVPCSYGNHGRTTIKSRISSGAENSYETHLYHSLAADFADEPRVVKADANSDAVLRIAVTSPGRSAQDERFTVKGYGKQHHHQ